VQFLTLQHEGWDEPGVLYDGDVIGLKGAGFDDLLSVVSGGADALDRVSRWLSSPPGSERFDPAKTRLRAPIPKPPKIVCIGLNYRDHAAEAKMALPEVPTVFAKFANTVTGHLHRYPFRICSDSSGCTRPSKISGRSRLNCSTSSATRRRMSSRRVIRGESNSNSRATAPVPGLESRKRTCMIRLSPAGLTIDR
jgi:hypothetical protein